MKKYFHFVSRFVCVGVILSLLFNPICEARTASKPIVIRKKIIIPAEENQKTTMPKPASEISDIDSDTEDDSNMDVETASASNKPPAYNPAGKINPFKPLFKETPKAQAKTVAYATTVTKPTEALETIDLSQLKLTGIILATSGNKALVKEASGTGHVITAGSRIGIHGGRVAQVLKDRVIVKEEMIDVSGRLFFQHTEIKLNKNG